MYVYNFDIQHQIMSVYNAARYHTQVK